MFIQATLFSDFCLAYFRKESFPLANSTYVLIQIPFHLKFCIMARMDSWFILVSHEVLKFSAGIKYPKIKLFVLTKRLVLINNKKSLFPFSSLAMFMTFSGVY